MKKDYTPDISTQQPKTEIEFIEDVWSKTWADESHGNKPVSVVETQEEFKIIKPYIATLPKEAKILDGGCGTGVWTRYYTQLGFKVAGIDISETTIKRIKSQYPECNFIRGDITKTDFDDNYFDAYFSWGTFEHFETGFGPCFKEAYRIIKPGGYLFISVPYHNKRHINRDQKDLWFWDESFDKNNGYSHPMRFYQWRLTKQELRREFEINGFRFIEVKAIRKITGIRRMIKHELKIDYQSPLHKLLERLLCRLVPKDYVSHMILGVGIKR